MGYVEHGTEEHPPRASGKWLRQHIDAQHDVAFQADASLSEMQASHAEMHRHREMTRIYRDRRGL